MATIESVTSLSLIAGADLTAAQFTFVSINNASEVVSTADGADAVGILMNNPNIGEAAEVGIAGRLKVVAGTTMTNGQQVASDANGKSKPSAAGSHILGRTVGAAAADELVAFVFQKNGVQA